SSLGGVDREMTLFDIAILTRANAARTIGLAHRKGHLGAGADGDVAVYEIDPEKFDPDDSEKVIRAFSRADLTIKDGKVVARQGEVVAVPDGRRYYCKPEVDEGLTKDMMADVREWFKYYTIGFANYPVPDKYLRNPEPIVVNGSEGGW
ncbi:MAG TPA: amidohydrolase family protein, partial [Methanothrix sp.]|nr:amidohydrolase family protein [Methanothrix sp.]